MTKANRSAGERNVRPWALGAQGLLVAGILLRLALYFPLAAFPADSDGAVTGLCGLQVLDGDVLVFSPDGTRHSAIRCYLSAFYFALVGPGRTGLALTGLTFEILYLVFMLLFLRRLLDARGAFLAMAFVVIPPVQFLIASYVPWGYGEVMAVSAAILYFAQRWREAPSRGIVFCFGLAAGLGLWFSLQTIMIAIPAAIWIAVRRGRAVFGESWPALLGATLGFAPWLIFNAAHGFPSLTQNFAARPANGAAQVWDNVLYLLAYNLPMLLANSSSHNWGAATLALLAAYGVIALGLVWACREPDNTPMAKGEHVRSAVALGLMVIGLSLLLSVVSEPGSIRGWTVRYIMPLYLVMPFLIAIGLVALGRRDMWLAAVPAIAILAVTLSGYSLPASSARAALTAELARHERLRQRLEEAKLDAVVGDFWLVYHLNFDSGRKLHAVPFQRNSDYFSIAKSLPPQDLRWGMIARSKDEALARAARVGAHGHATDFEGVTIFLPDPPRSTVPTSELMQKLRGAL